MRLQQRASAVEVTVAQVWREAGSRVRTDVRFADRRAGVGGDLAHELCVDVFGSVAALRDAPDGQVVARGNAVATRPNAIDRGAAIGVDRDLTTIQRQLGRRQR